MQVFYAKNNNNNTLYEVMLLRVQFMLLYFSISIKVLKFTNNKKNSKTFSKLKPKTNNNKNYFSIYWTFAIFLPSNQQQLFFILFLSLFFSKLNNNIIRNTQRDKETSGKKGKRSIKKNRERKY